MGTPEPASSTRVGRWPWAMVGGGLSFFIGGLLHPQDYDPALSESANLAMLLDNPSWIPAHVLLVLASGLFAVGLAGLLGHRPELPSPARRAGWVAVAGAGAMVVESVPHTLATLDGTRAAAGQPTPIVSTHEALALLAYPLFGLGVVALVVLGGRGLAHPAVGVMGVLGGLAWGFAPWGFGPLGIEEAELLFLIGDVLLSAWVVVVGAVELARRRARTQEALL